jgi:hypothetical protein
MSLKTTPADSVVISPGKHVPSLPPRALAELITNHHPISFYPLRSVILGTEHPESAVLEHDRARYSKDFSVANLREPLRDPQLEDLRQKLIKVCILALREWKRASSYNPDYESTYELVELFTRKSACTHLCLHNLGKFQKLAGATLALTDVADFSDAELFPRQMLEEKVFSQSEFSGSEVVRAVRLFTAGYARYKFMGEVSRQLMDRLLAYSDGRPLLTCISQLNTPSISLVKANGFEGTGEVIDHAGVPYEWYVYPPFSGTAARARFEHQRAASALKVFELRAIAPAAGVLSGDRVAVVGSLAGEIAPRLHSVANMSVVGVVPAVSRPLQRLENSQIRFVASNVNDGEVNLERSIFDGIFVPSALEESGSDQAQLLLSGCHHSLKDRGIFVSRGYVASSDRDTLAQVRQLLLSKEGGLIDGPPGVESSAALFEFFMRHPGAHSQEHWSVAREDESALVIECSPWLAEFFDTKGYYWRNYDTELSKPVGCWTREEWVSRFQEAGFRVLYSMDERNPWIEQNRRQGRIEHYDNSGSYIPSPATGHVVAAMKVVQSEGVRWEPQTIRSPDSPTYLRTRTFQSSVDGRLWGIAVRPTEAIEFLPYIKKDDGYELLVLDTRDRPLGTLHRGEGNIADHRYLAGYLSEQISLICPSSAETSPIAAFLTAADHAISHQQLYDFARSRFVEEFGLNVDSIVEMSPGFASFSSPGMLTETVMSQPIGVNLEAFQRLKTVRHGSGVVRSFDARWALGASHTGAWSDGRLERTVYHLLRSKGETLGPWLGAPIVLREHSYLEASRYSRDNLQLPSRKSFKEASAGTASSFLALRTADFTEYSATGEVLARETLEFVEPAEATGLSLNTLSTIPVFSANDQLYVVLEERDLPAVQVTTGSSAILVAPAARLLLSIKTLDEAMEKNRADLLRRYGLKTFGGAMLGTGYYPAIGVTPEVVIPTWTEVHPESVSDLLGVSQPKNLRALPLDLVMKNLDLITDGHTLTLLNRLAHAVTL